MSLAPTDPRHVELQRKYLALGLCFGPGIGLIVGLLVGMLGAGLMLGFLAGQWFGIFMAKHKYQQELTEQETGELNR